MNNLLSTLSKCAFRDDEFARFFTSLSDGHVNNDTASILRQLFGEVLAGVSELNADTGWKNPASLSGTLSVGEVWARYGWHPALESICKNALMEGARFKDIRNFIRAYNGEKIVIGTFIPKDVLNEWAMKVHYYQQGEEYQYGVFNDDGRIIQFMGKRVHRVGRAYFVEEHIYRQYPVDFMWVKNI